MHVFIDFWKLETENSFLHIFNFLHKLNFENSFYFLPILSCQTSFLVLKIKNCFWKHKIKGENSYQIYLECLVSHHFLYSLFFFLFSISIHRHTLNLRKLIDVYYFLFIIKKLIWGWRHLREFSLSLMSERKREAKMPLACPTRC